MSKNEQKSSYKKTALSGSVYVLVAQFIKIALLFLSIIVLSRILTPEDFGLIACLTPIIAFITLLQDLGLQQAVIQRDKISDEQINKVFWVLSAVGLFFAISLCILSPAIAWFYHDDRLLLLTILTSIPLAITSMASLPISLLNRSMKFNNIAIIDITANLLGFIATVIGALLGMSYWSLLLTPFFLAFTTLIGALWLSKWRPNRPQFKLDKDILHFGANLTGSNIINFFARNLDNILIGRYEGVQPLGFYERAYKLLMFPLSSINAPISKVIIPILSNIQSDKERVRRIYLRVIGILTLIIVPGMAALIIVPEDVVLLLFGEKWLAVAPIFFWLGMAGLVQPLANSTSWVFISQGLTKEMLRWNIFASSTTIIAIIIGLNWGVVGVAMAYAINEYLVRLPVFFWYMGKISPIKSLDFIRIQIPLLIAAIISFAITHYIFKNLMVLEGIIVIIAAVICSYSCAILISLMHKTGRNILSEAIKLGLDAIHKIIGKA